MTKGQALQQFWSSFGLTAAYPSTAVPSDAVFPFGVYEVALGGWEDQAALSCNLWFYTESEAIPNAKAQEISDYIGIAGVTIPCDGGLLWIKRGSPFAQPVTDQSDPAIKRRLLNITVEFLTLN